MMYTLRKIVLIALIAAPGLFVTSSVLAASTLLKINVDNTHHKAIVSVNFNGDRPLSYNFFSLPRPERIVLDVKSRGKIDGLPLSFSSQNLVTGIRSGAPKDHQSMRLVFDLAHPVKMRVNIKKRNSAHILIFALISARGANAHTAHKSVLSTQTPINTLKLMHMAPKGANFFIKKPAAEAGAAAGITSSRSHASISSSDQVVVAIDAGHGGQDPGAIGPSDLKEKNVTIAVAHRLKALLSSDPQFKPVLTRHGDYFISVTGRSDVARKQGANVLVSIHADAAPNPRANGASVWVLSNRRAHSEMAGWLEQYEKQSELLGGSGDMLVNSQADPYLSQAVLDLQFGHSQRVGYDVGLKVLQQLQHVGSLHKRRPEYASLGVLRSPDIPSFLVETGFISNSTEERLLASSAYQNKIASAIYNGLLNYFLTHPLQIDPIIDPRQSKPQEATRFRNKNISFSRTSPRMDRKIQIHVVQNSETLSSIAESYGTTLAVLRELNKLKKNRVRIGQRLKVHAVKAKGTVIFTPKLKILEKSR